MATAQKSVEDIFAEIEELKKQLESKKEEVVADIKTKIEMFKLGPEDLFMPSYAAAPKAGKAKASKAQSSSVAKYKHPETGDTWSGKGRAPKWMKDKAGNINEEYAITKPAEQAAQ
jgi:DNA-binding protein H-NS